MKPRCLQSATSFSRTSGWVDTGMDVGPGLGWNLLDRGGRGRGTGWGPGTRDQGPDDTPRDEWIAPMSRRRARFVAEGPHARPDSAVLSRTHRVAEGDGSV